MFDERVLHDAAYGCGFDEEGDNRDNNEEEEGEQRDICCPDIPRCGWIPSEQWRIDT